MLVNRFRILGIVLVGIICILFVPFIIHDKPDEDTSFLNGVWVDAFNPGIHSEAQTDKLIQDIHSAGINTVFIQARRRGDLIFPSSFEPKISSIRGGWDPFTYLNKFRSPHQKEVKGLEPLSVHAWIVCGPVWNQESIKNVPDGHILQKHPDWLMVRDDGETFENKDHFLELGLPQVQQYLTDLIGELADSGLVDGIHLDYIRYPGRRWGYHPDVVKEFQILHNRNDIPEPNDQDWMTFRRQKVTQLVERIHLRVKNANPQIVLSAATITFAPAPQSSGDWKYTSAYAHLFQDWKHWLDSGLIDYAIPMCYFRDSTHLKTYNEWLHFLSGWDAADRIAIGLATYLNDHDANLRQATYALKLRTNEKNFCGIVGYSYAHPQMNHTNSVWAADYAINLKSKSSPELEKLVFSKVPNALVAQDIFSPGMGHAAFLLSGDSTMTNEMPYKVEISNYKMKSLIKVVPPSRYVRFNNLSPGIYRATIVNEGSQNNDDRLPRLDVNFEVNAGKVSLIETTL